MLANLMALQAGKDMIDYTPIDKTVNLAGYNEYIVSIHEGFCENYKKIKNIFLKLLTETCSN